MPNNTKYERKPTTSRAIPFLKKPSESSSNMRENPKQRLVYGNTLERFERDEDLVKFITKTINEVMNKRMDVIEKQIQEHFSRLYIANK